MNERIWKLAEHIVCFEQDMDGSMEPNEEGEWIRADDLQKFAELIVLECSKVTQQSITHGIGMAITEGISIEVIKQELPDYVKRKIKEHFGVKE